MAYPRHCAFVRGDGYTTIPCRDEKLILPPNWDVDENRPVLASQILSHNIEDGGIVLIGGSNTGEKEASAAVNSAALDLVS